MLVLAFSVQGIAEALTLSRPSTCRGDLQTVPSRYRPLTIRFSVGSTSGESLKPNHHALPSGERTDAESYFIDTTGDDPNNNNQFDSGETKVSRGD